MVFTMSEKEGRASGAKEWHWRMRSWRDVGHSTGIARGTGVPDVMAAIIYVVEKVDVHNVTHTRT